MDTDKRTMTLNDVKQSLRKLKFNKYVGNICYMYHVLTNTPLRYSKHETKTRWSACSTEFNGCLS